MRKDIEAALNKFQINTFGNKKNIENFESVLKNDENVLYICPTNIVVTNANTKKREAIPCICALTDKRFVFKYKILFETNFENIDLDKINSIDYSGNSISGGHIQINTLTKTYDILCTYKKEIMNEIQETFETAINNYKNNNIKHDENNNDIIEQIKKLSSLKDNNIISKEEFEQKKKELLSRL